MNLSNNFKERRMSLLPCIPRMSMLELTKSINQHYIQRISMLKVTKSTNQHLYKKHMMRMMNFNHKITSMNFKIQLQNIHGMPKATSIVDLSKNI